MNLKIAYQGVPGAYSHIACQNVYPNQQYIPHLSFAEAMNAVQTGTVDLAMIPVENSNAGRVSDVHFLLPETGLHIVGEYFLRIEHMLLGLKGSKLDDIKTASSHPQALAQCSGFLQLHHIQPVQRIDTALSCQDIINAQDKTKAAIASKLAGEIYGLDILQPNIENARNIHAFIQSLNLPHKNDKLDAQAIARFGTERQPKPTNRPSKTILIIRELSRERTALIKARVDLENRRDTLTSPIVRKINAQTLATLTTQIEKIDREIKACVVQDEELLSEVHIMTTMPGVSFISAYSILAEIGSLKQYSAKELSSLSGLAPRIVESGSSVHSSYLSRKSSGRLRQILYLDSVPGVPKIPVLQEFHQRLIGKGKKKMTARCACMRKMLLILRSMVVHNTPFNENFPNNLRKGLDF